jgi:hypothetical protein
MLVGHADHRGFEDAVEGEQRPLHLDRIDREAAALDDLLLAPGDVNATEFVEIPEVSRVEPAIGEHLRRGLLAAVVTAHQRWAMHCDLADLARGDGDAVLVDYADPHHPHRMAGVRRILRELGRRRDA